MTYGRTMKKQMAKFPQINPDLWYELASDRGAWEEALKPSNFQFDHKVPVSKK